VEYAVMLALIIVVCITAITTLGTNANNTFSYVSTQVGKTGS
jgi:pilus assembly protein Flp/PilA